MIVMLNHVSYVRLDILGPTAARFQIIQATTVIQI